MARFQKRETRPAVGVKTQAKTRYRRRNVRPRSSPLLTAMILYLLFPLLLTGVEESQTASVATEAGEMATATMARDNATSSLKDEMRQIEDELLSNQTSETIITDDDESFQDQDAPHGHCLLDVLTRYTVLCAENFHKEMQTIGSGNRCRLESFTKPYSDMTLCLEVLSEELGCFYPNTATQDFFLHIHAYYFKNCTMEEPVLKDTPHGMVIALTLLPVGLIPILVHLVVWKSKVQK
ncbi:hypothetical protein INR49_005830 [Caranx melampygus]|nr:hypothetical protein INR49_005830 [Caranx melampygus]